MDENNKIFSVIIPMYNGAATIENALSSLIPSRQYLKEVIIANDRSTDNCIELAHQFDSMLPMKYIDVPDELPHGPGNGRNVGLEIATGDWIAFLDCDDMYSMTSFTDIFNAVKITNTDKLASITTSFLQYTIEENTYTQVPNQDPSYMHGHFYKKEFLNKYNIRNHPDILIIEDGYFNLLFNATCQEYDYVNSYYPNVNTYIWRVHVGHQGLSYLADPAHQKDTNFTIQSRLTCVKEILKRFGENKGGAYKYALKVTIDSLLSGYFEYAHAIEQNGKEQSAGLIPWNTKILTVLTKDFELSKENILKLSLDEQNFAAVKATYEMHFGPLNPDFTLEEFYQLIEEK